MSNLPTLSKGESPSLWDIDYEDTGRSSEMDGGYVFTRPKHTRGPRRTFKSGWKDVPQADFDTLMTFYGTVGTYDGFNYTNYMNSDEVVNVRFKAPPKPKYEGVGTNKRYDIEIIMEEV